MATARLAAMKDSQFKIFNYEIPVLSLGGALIKVEAASICGSDDHILGMQLPKHGCQGHEFTGRIVDMDPQANSQLHVFGGPLKIGDRVAVYPWITCGTCNSCMTYGEGVCGVCEDGFIYGGPMQLDPNKLNCDPELFPHFKGGFAEYVYLFPRTFVWKVPEDMPPTIATLLDPTAVAMRAVELASSEIGVLQEGVNTNTRALVIGAGPIGILSGMILKHMGVESLLITDMETQKLKKAQEISGADSTLCVNGMSSEERIEAVYDLTGGGANLVLNCANHPSSMIEGLQMVRALGTYVEVGNAFSFGKNHEIPVDLPKLVFSKNARITGVIANSQKTFDRAFRLLKKHNEIPFAKLVTHTFHNLEQLGPTMEKMRDVSYLKGVYVPLEA